MKPCVGDLKIDSRFCPGTGNKEPVAVNRSWPGANNTPGCLCGCSLLMQTWC